MNCAVSWRLRQPAKEHEGWRDRMCPKGKIREAQSCRYRKRRCKSFVVVVVGRSSSSKCATRKKKLFGQRNGPRTQLCVMLAGDGWNE